MRILVVEDSEYDRLVLVSTIQQVAPKANIVTAATKREAIDTIGRMRFDLVFMDVMLPDDPAGGAKATRAIIDSDPHTIVVLLTTLREDHPSIEKITKVDGVFHFQKPVPKEDVEAAVQAVRTAKA